jgi:hypothetical protein
MILIAAAISCEMLRQGEFTTETAESNDEMKKYGTTRSHYFCQIL